MKRKGIFISIGLIVLFSLAVGLTFSTAQSMQPAAQPQVELGEPGLSYRYTETLGETGVPYVEDSDHLNYPWGIGSDGTNIWIGENLSSRALKFTGDGTFLMQIGSSSFRAFQNIFQVVDVGVDGAGNIWLVDAPANHILKYDPSGSQIGELGQMWGDCSSANDRFCNPRGIAIDASGNIYVSESGNARIQIFDSAGSYLVTLGTGVAGPGNDQFDEPEHIAVYANELYVADSVNQRIQIFDITSPITPTYVATIGETGVPGDDNDHFACPNGVSLDDAYLYIADACNNRIQIFDRTARTYFATLGSGPGQGNDEFDLPTDVVVDSAGNLYVADYNNTRVQQFDPTWEYARTYGSIRVPYLPDGHYNSPLVSTDAEDNILITEEWGHRLIKLNPDGILQWSFGEAGVSGWDNEHLSAPTRVAADNSGNIYVPEAWNCRVQIISPDGEYLNTLGISCGSGADQINGPRGVAMGSNGLIYIADSENQRVQIFDISTPATPTLVATLGEFYDAPAQGCLSDNDHFCFPSSVALDSAGNIFVVDTDNHRVQKFNSDLDYQMTIGTGVQGNQFDQFSWPVDVVVDAPGNVYVSDLANNRVQVFDATGAYLTTIGGAWGTNSAQFISASSVAVDREGNVYVSDQQNSRIQVYAPGVPDWKQVNINGFGNPNVQSLPSLDVFNDTLYAGTANYADGEYHLYRSTNAEDWEQVSQDFDAGVSGLIAFDDQLFAGTWSGSLWSSPDGLDWTQVMTSSLGIASFSQFNATLFAGTYCNDEEGATIWQTTDGVDWSPLVTNGNGDPNACGVISSAEFDGNLYFGVGDWSGTSGGRIWRTDGITITEVVGNGFGNPQNRAPGGLAVLGDWLYASIYNPDSDQVWRSDSGDPGSWEMVLEIGLGEPGFKDRTGLIVLEDHLFLTAQNDQSGMQVWMTADGETWQQISFEGFGNSNNIWSEWEGSLDIFNGQLYIGVNNNANGNELWRYEPEVTASFTATPTAGAVPLEVTFTNTSSGTLTANLWDFGDGVTSTLTSPTHIYESTGVYTVTLTADSFGNTDTITMTNFITVELNKVFLPVVSR